MGVRIQHLLHPDVFTCNAKTSNDKIPLEGVAIFLSCAQGVPPLSLHVRKNVRRIKNLTSVLIYLDFS